MFLFSAAKIVQEFVFSNSLEEIIVIYIQIVRNQADFMRENHILTLIDQFAPKSVI